MVEIISIRILLQFIGCFGLNRPKQFVARVPDNQYLYLVADLHAFGNTPRVPACVASTILHVTL